ARLVGRYVTGVGEGAAPTVPVAALRRVGQRRRSCRATRGLGERRGRSHRTSGEELGDGFLFRVVQVVALPVHVARRQRREDGLRRELAEAFAIGLARIAPRLLMTRRARLVVQRLTVWRLREGID